MTAPMPGWAAGFVGIPQRDHGRSRDGADCWGLAVIAYAELAGIALPLYRDAVSPDERAEVAAAIAGEASTRPWRAVDGPAAIRPLDVIVIRQGRWASHLGLVDDPRRRTMLHMGPTGARIERFDAPAVRSRITGWWRHAALA